MLTRLFAAARPAAPVARDLSRHLRKPRRLTAEHRPGVLTTEELRRAVAEVIG